MNETQLLKDCINQMVLVANNLGASPALVPIQGNGNLCDLLRIQITVLKAIVALT